MGTDVENDDGTPDPSIIDQHVSVAEEGSDGDRTVRYPAHGHAKRWQNRLRRDQLRSLLRRQRGRVRALRRRRGGHPDSSSEGVDSHGVGSGAWRLERDVTFGVREAAERAVQHYFLTTFGL